MPEPILSPQPEPEFAALVAIDWADQKHVWCLPATGTSQREHGQMPHTPEAVQNWVAKLSQRFGSRPIALAVEQTRGALLFMLTKYESLHLYPIHPRTLAPYRAALFPSGTKDDPLDAGLLLDLLVHHRNHLRRLEPDSESTRKLQFLVEARRKMVNEKTRQSNRLTAQLKLYFPQTLQWFDDVTSPLAGAFLQRWPTLENAQQVDPEILREFFWQHNCRSQDRLPQRLQQIRQALPATQDRAVLEAAVATVGVLLQLLAVLRQGIAALEQQIQQVTAAHPDSPLFDSLPGAGPILVPRLIAAFGSRRDRFRSAAEILSYSGIAPVLARSGKSQWTHFRWACPKFLRQTFHEWAGHSITASAWARAYYQQQRSRGNDHHAAVRALAFQWIRIVFRCWQDRQPYSEGIYLNRLRQRHSPLAADQPTSVSIRWKSCAGFWKLTDTPS